MVRKIKSAVRVINLLVSTLLSHGRLQAHTQPLRPNRRSPLCQRKGKSARSSNNSKILRKIELYITESRGAFDRSVRKHMRVIRGIIGQLLDMKWRVCV